MPVVILNSKSVSANYFRSNTMHLKMEKYLSTCVLQIKRKEIYIGYVYLVAWTRIKYLVYRKKKAFQNNTIMSEQCSDDFKQLNTPRGTILYWWKNKNS